MVSYSGQIIVCGRSRGNATHEVGLVDPRTGSFHSVANLSASLEDGLQGSIAAFDPLGNRTIIAFARGGRTEVLAVVHMPTGNTTLLRETPAHTISSLAYDPAQHAFFALGTSGADSANRTLLRLDARLHGCRRQLPPCALSPRLGARGGDRLHLSFSPPTATRLFSSRHKRALTSSSPPTLP